MHADKIIVLNEGDVVGIGTHKRTVGKLLGLLRHCSITIIRGGVGTMKAFSSLKRLGATSNPTKSPLF